MKKMAAPFGRLIRKSLVKVDLKSGSAEIVSRQRSNVPRWLKNFVKQVTGKIMLRWDRNVARWSTGCE